MTTRRRRALTRAQITAWKLAGERRRAREHEARLHDIDQLPPEEQARVREREEMRRRCADPKARAVEERKAARQRAKEPDPRRKTR